MCYTGCVNGVFLGFFLLVAAVTLAPANTEEARLQLRDAVELARRGEVQQVWSLLQSAKPFHRENVADILDISIALQKEGWHTEAANLLAECLKLQPNLPQATGRLSYLFRRFGPPLWIQHDLAAFMPMHFIRTWDENGTQRCAVAAPKDPQALLNQSDPKYGFRFHHCTWAYCSDNASDSLKLRFAVHFQRNTDAPLAVKCSRVLLAIYILARERLGLLPRFSEDGVVHVWLCTDGHAGAEQWQNHLYFYAIDTPRQPSEWIRQLCHEYGHLVIPGIGPFDAPEEWANGLIGERLFMKWLAGGEFKELWNPSPDLQTFVQSGADRLLREFVQTPAPIDGARWSADLCIALALYAEAAHGPQLLAEIIASQETRTPQQFWTAYKKALQKRASFEVRKIEGLKTFLVPIFSDAQCNISSERQDVSLYIDDKPIKPGAWIALKTGWHKIRCVPDNISSITITQKPAGRSSPARR